MKTKSVIVVIKSLYGLYFSHCNFKGVYGVYIYNAYIYIIKNDKMTKMTKINI